MVTHSPRRRTKYFVRASKVTCFIHTIRHRLYNLWNAMLLFYWLCTSQSTAFLLTASSCQRQRSKHSIVPSLESIVRKETFYSKKERNLFSINELLNGSSAAQNPPNAHPMESRFNDDRRKGGLLQNSKDIMDGLSLIAFSVIAACLLISWEDLTCKYVLPSRHRTSLTLYQSSPLGWGASTTNGMGFGSTERQMLLSSSEQASTLDDGDPMLILPSYNEVMLQHRTKTVPQWKHTVAPSDVSSAIHTYVAALQKLEILQSMADDYQWDEIRFYLHSSPISDLASQSAVLRQFSSDLNEIVGFDWGSCAWRHCGAIADVQEAVDELDQLLGVLEPYEAVFCLDIVERCLRDVLIVVPWKYASADDKLSYASMPVYLPKTSTHSLDSDVSSSRIDDTYFRALQELRID